jgi:hypothetical protein
MSAYLLTWNPARWHWANFAQDCESVKRGSFARQRWSCGKSRSIATGSRFFLIRLGTPPKGIIGTGQIVSPPFEDIHWDLPRRKRGENCWCVQIEFDALTQTPMVGWDELQRPGLRSFPWGSRSSGIVIRSPYLEQLEKAYEYTHEQIQLDCEFTDRYRDTFRSQAK